MDVSSASIDLEQEVKWQDENADLEEGGEYMGEMDSFESKNNYGQETEEQIQIGKSGQLSIERITEEDL